MASENRVSHYTIELNLEAGDATRRTIDDVEKSLQKISDSAKKGLGDGLTAATKEAEKLAHTVHDLATGEKDATEELQAYSRASGKAIKDLEKQANTLTYSLSEQGKAQRQRLKDLRAELSTLGDTKAEIAEKKEIEKEIKAIQKDVVEASDAELQSALKQNRAARASLKLAQQEAKLGKVQAQEQKKLSALVKDDLKTLKEKIRAQFKFIELLKTTEGRYKAIKLAASKIGGFAMKAGKAAIMGGGGLVGGAMALASSGVQAATLQDERAREATRIRAAMSQEDKEALLSEIYVDTGADTGAIVDAINRVVSILGPHAKRHEISRAVEAEIRYPGASAMFMQDTENPVKASDFSIYQNRMKALQAVTGATQEQIAASTQKIANLPQGAFSRASMTELQAVYLGLQGSGGFDTQEELDRAFDAFVKMQAKSGKSVFDVLYDFDWKKYGEGNTNRYQIENALRSVQWGALDKAAHTTSTDIRYTTAEETASRMRKMEETKNKLLIKIMEAIEPVIDKIDPAKIAKIFEKITDILALIADRLGGAMEANNVFEAADRLAGVKDESWFSAASAKKRRDAVADFFGFADGGLATMPAICGESGPEMVIPLDPSRRPRAEALTQTVMQTFNMRGNETTLLSLSAAVRSRDFNRALANNAYINSRCGR